MSVEGNKAIVRRLVEEGWANPDILDELLAADVAWRPGDNSGLDAYKQMFSTFFAGFPDGRFVAKDIIVEGDEVAARWAFSGTHTGELWGIPPTNKEIAAIPTKTACTIPKIFEKLCNNCSDV